jgi:DNA (cytosine-5)-methyltransferase 1
MKLLDLFCGGGGAAMGYHRAGFDEIVGVDIRPMPRYPFTFIQGDALEYVREYGRGFDAIHASPPCQAYSEATPMAYRANHPDLIGVVRDALIETGKPYAIENVEGARKHLLAPVMLCGTMFGLPIYRHRYFEMQSAIVLSPSTCAHKPRPLIIDIDGMKYTSRIPILCSGGGDGRQGNVRSQTRVTMRKREKVAVIRWAMQIDWMTQNEITESIPPAYTEFIGRHLLEYIRVKA